VAVAVIALAVGLGGALMLGVTTATAWGTR